MTKKIISISTIILVLLAPITASAHVVVKPAEVKPGSFERFAVGVPVEKEIPTIALRLVIPEGLNYVTPYVKTGWNIETKKTFGEKANVTEISWTGGNIPAGQKDEFIFSAQVPSTETSLKWKGYQTYSDGGVVNWDMEPATDTKKDDDNPTPYSITKVITPTPILDTKITNSNNRDGILLYLMTGLSLFVSIGTGVFVGNKLKKKD